MLTDDEIDAMRATVEAAMPDRCTITRKGTATFDAGAGTYSATTATLWSGPCRVVRQATEGREQLVGDEHRIAGRYSAVVPFDADGFDVDDYLTVTATSTDVALAGRPLRIVDVRVGSWALGRHLACEELSP